MTRNNGAASGGVNAEDEAEVKEENKRIGCARSRKIARKSEETSSIAYLKRHLNIAYWQHAGA